MYLKVVRTLSITADLIRGHTETIILSRLMISDSYGYRINKSILSLTNNEYELKEATLYSAFKRLEESGQITSYWGDESTGARRRYYSITDMGKQTYQRLCSDWQITKKMLDTLIGAGNNEYNIKGTQI